MGAVYPATVETSSVLSSAPTPGIFSPERPRSEGRVPRSSEDAVIRTNAERILPISAREPQAQGALQQPQCHLMHVPSTVHQGSGGVAHRQLHFSLQMIMETA